MKLILILLFTVIASICCDAQKLEYDKMLFPIWDSTLKAYGCVDIHGKTIVPFRYHNFYVQKTLSIDNPIATEMKNEEERMKPWTLGWALFYMSNKDSISAFHFNKPYDAGRIITYCSDGYFIYKNNKKYGCIDTNEKEILPCKFDVIYLDLDINHKLFQNGYVNAIENQQMKIVQNNGNILTSGVFYEYNYTDNEAFVVSNKDNKYGVCNNKGEMVYPCISDEITYSHTTKLFIIKKGDTYGCINEHGKIIVPFIYTSMYDTDKGLISVEKDNKFGCIDKTGNLVIPFISGYNIEFNLNDEIAVFSPINGKIMNELDNFGYITREGKIIIPCQYTYAYDFKGDYALVCTDPNPDNLDSNLWHCINKEGKRVISNIKIQDFYLSPNGYYCERNKNGYHFKMVEGSTPNSLLQCWFEKPSYFDKNGYAIIERGGMKWIINTLGENVFDNKYDEIGTKDEFGLLYSGFKDYNEYLWIVKKNGFEGVIDLKSKKTIIPCKYDRIEYRDGINNGMVKVMRNNKYGYVELKYGKEIIPCEYSFLTARLKKFQYLYYKEKNNDVNIQMDDRSK